MKTHILTMATLLLLTAPAASAVGPETVTPETGLHCVLPTSVYCAEEYVDWVLEDPRNPINLVCQIVDGKRCLA